MYVMKAVVKLPPRSRQSTLMDHGSRYDPVPKLEKSDDTVGGDFLVSNKLYLKDLPFSISEDDILDVVGECDPVKVQLHNDVNHVTGWLTFPNREKADQAYTLFNGAHFRNGSRLQLSIYPPNDPQEPEAMSGILQIRYLPNHTTNKLLYQWFRPWGPMNLCKIIVEQDAIFKGAAFVQYFRSEDGDAAMEAMNNKNVQGSVISVYPFIGRMQHHGNDTYDHSNSSERESHAMNNGNGGSARSPAYHSNGSPRNDSHSPVDFTNLYIKNLDLNVKSSDLFNQFRRFGRIISARVMKNTQTKQSKGFGFVSFSKTEEAHRALQEMDGTNIFSKPVIVAFHEPKKPRSEKSAMGDAPLSHNGLSPPPPSFSPPLPSGMDYQRTHDPHKRYSTPNGSGYGSSFANPPPLSIHPSSTPHEYMQSHKPSSQHPTSPFTPYPRDRNALGGYHHNLGTYPRIAMDKYAKQPNGYKQVQPMIHVTNTPAPSHPSHPHSHLPAHCAPPSLSTLASGAFINTPPALSMPNYPEYKITPQGRPTLRRRGSVESISSIMTETSSNVQRQRMRSAVVNCCGETHDLEDIVDMLLTLKRKERSLCLFNADILKTKITQARGALEIFQDDEDMQHVPALGLPKKVDMDTISKSVNMPSPARLSVPPRSSRAIPIVAPPLSSPDKAVTPTATSTAPPSSGATTGPTRDQELHQEIDNFLKTLEGLAVHEKKQKLGDRLFPLVKATGVRHAPKITIRLLDSVPLDELAHSMYDKAQLQSKVDGVIGDDKLQ